MANYILKKDGNLYNKETGHMIKRTKKKAAVWDGKRVISIPEGGTKDYWVLSLNGKKRWIQCNHTDWYDLTEYNIEVEEN